MKRKQHNPSIARGKRTGELDADRLIRVRGGLGITVVAAGTATDVATQQHNEALVRL
jgi:hypothetical protein